MGKRKEDKVRVYSHCPKCGKYVEVKNEKLKGHTYLISGKRCEGK